jgi:hypothetical protein
MKTELQKALAKIAPSIAIRTIWGHDTDMHPDIRKDCDGMDDENPDDWQCWQSEVRATAIVNGEEIHGSASMGGTWEKSGDNPAVSNLEISGYENQMTVEALDDLRHAIPADIPLEHQLYADIDAAIVHCQKEAQPHAETPA